MLVAVMVGLVVAVVVVMVVAVAAVTNISSTSTGTCRPFIVRLIAYLPVLVKTD